MEERILALADRRADQAEVFSEEVDRTVVEFRAGRLHAQETRLTRGYGLRVIKDGRLGFASGTDPNRITELVDAAMAGSAFGRQARFDFPTGARGGEVRTCENRVLLVPGSRMVEWGEGFVDVMRARVPDVKFDLTFTRTYRETKIRNTSELAAGFERAEFDLSVTGLWVSDGLTRFSDYVNLSAGRHFEVEPVADRLERLVGAARRRARLASGRYPVIVMPMALPSMLAPLGYNVSGKHREKGTTPLVGQEGKRLVSEAVTIADNPLRNFGLGSRPFDAEGVPSRRNVLFERGVFRGFLFDLGTGAACRCASTGSAIRWQVRPTHPASRGYCEAPRPGAAGIEIEPGTAELEKSVREMGEGLVVYGFVGAGQSNVLAGEVALGVSLGLAVESGEITGRVKDVMIAGNLYEMLATVDAVGWVQEDLGDRFLPFVRFPSVPVAARDD